MLREKKVTKIIKTQQSNRQSRVKKLNLLQFKMSLLTRIRFESVERVSNYRMSVSWLHVCFNETTTKKSIIFQKIYFCRSNTPYLMHNSHHIITIYEYEYRMKPASLQKLQKNAPNCLFSIFKVIVIWL